MANTFRSHRLLFRAWDWPADDAYIAKRQLDVAGQANISSFLLRPSSKADLEGLKKWNEAALLAVVICLPAASETEAPIPIGDITLAGGDARFAHHRTRDIGVWVLPEFQGMGYGSEAIEWITDWGFRFGGLHRIGMWEIFSSSFFFLVDLLFSSVLLFD